MLGVWVNEKGLFPSLPAIMRNPGNVQNFMECSAALNFEGERDLWRNGKSWQIQLRAIVLPHLWNM